MIRAVRSSAISKEGPSSLSGRLSGLEASCGVRTHCLTLGVGQSMDQLCQAFLSLLHRGNGCVEGLLFGPQNDLILLTLLLCGTLPAHQVQTGMQ